MEVQGSIEHQPAAVLIPDSRTSYRSIYAVLVYGESFNLSERSSRSRLPLFAADLLLRCQTLRDDNIESVAASWEHTMLSC